MKGCRTQPSGWVTDSEGLDVNGSSARNRSTDIPFCCWGTVIPSRDSSLVSWQWACPRRGWELSLDAGRLPRGMDRSAIAPIYLCSSHREVRSVFTPSGLPGAILAASALPAWGKPSSLRGVSPLHESFCRWQLAGALRWLHFHLWHSNYVGLEARFRLSQPWLVVL